MDVDLAFVNAIISGVCCLEIAISAQVLFVWAACCIPDSWKLQAHGAMPLIHQMSQTSRASLRACSFESCA